MRQRIASYLTGDGIKARAIRGTMLTVFGFGVQNVLRLASNLVLTRLLFPEAFGLMALVQVVLTLVAMFSDLGIRGSIVQDARGEDRDFLNTAWTLQIIRGVILWLAIWALAAPIAAFYEAPELSAILPVAGLTALIQGFNSTAIVSASRVLAVGRVTALTLATQAVGIVAMIALAWWWQSVWALVIGGLVAPFGLAVFSHVVLPWERNRLRFERDALGRLIGFGKYIFLATIAGFLINHGDRAVLGKFVPLSDLAIYNIGYFLASVPMLMGRRLIEHIVFPLYARRPPWESDVNRRHINRARALLTAVLVAGAGVLALIGDPMVRLLYDVRYEGAGPIMVLIALSFLPVLITMSYDNLALAAGDSGRFAAIIMGSAVVRIGVLIVGVQWFGLGGVAIAPAVAAVLFYPVLVVLVRRYRGWDPLHDAGYGLVALAIAAATLWLYWDVVAPLFVAF